ncbi:MAG: SDR family NAD(P)-dependent oxidoreductase [Burkholderiaceae bacterium]|nr:SDR family NAD(P)-dependent oxidoreductase [Burkholderiaceae bacterium]
MNRFENQIAIVTAASAGIGRACAEIMAGEGATVLMVARDGQRLEAAVAAINAQGGRAYAMAADATLPDTARAVVAHAEREWGRIDVLVNGVGGSTVIAEPLTPIDEMSHADWQKMIAFNLDATFHHCHAAIPVMKRARYGKIVNVASIAGRGLGALSGSAYVTAKAGLIGFTKKLAGEVGPWNITVNAIAPSFTLSERFQPLWDRMGEAGQQELLAKIPLRRVGTAVDQANVVCFLASGQSGFVTGVTIDVTGGQF